MRLIHCISAFKIRINKRQMFSALVVVKNKLMFVRRLQPPLFYFPSQAHGAPWQSHISLDYCSQPGQPHWPPWTTAGRSCRPNSTIQLGALTRNHGIRRPPAVCLATSGRRWECDVPANAGSPRPHLRAILTRSRECDAPANAECPHPQMREILI